MIQLICWIYHYLFEGISVQFDFYWNGLIGFGNCLSSFHGNLLVVRAIKDVKKGGEIFNCYGPHYRRMRRSERLEALEAQYCFTCQCQSCLDTETEDFQVIYNRLQLDRVMNI